jgi:hypothetical protein
MRFWTVAEIPPGSRPNSNDVERLPFLFCRNALPAPMPPATLSLHRTVRHGTPADQDRWRRDDYRRMTPQQRLDLAVRLREAAWPDAPPLQRIAILHRRAVA